jgi:hypothetical protein
MRSAVLLIIFNRPETTQVVFEAIRKARPARLYIAADGPRSNFDGEIDLCEKTRSIIGQIDWDCEVKTLFRDSNLGCRDAVSGAIDWFFKNEEEGIILEDDVVPDINFFGFCDLMLERYRYEDKIMMISGFNPLGAGLTSSSYFYSQYASIWGWASWRSRWIKYDVNIAQWSEKKYRLAMKDILPLHVLEYFVDAYEKIKKRQMNTWDYQWSLTIQMNKLLVIRPCANLIMNIGSIGTHSSRADKNHHIPFGYLNLNQIKSPSIQQSDKKKDLTFYRYAFSDQKYSLLMRYFLRKIALLKIVRIIKGKLFLANKG